MLALRNLVIRPRNFGAIFFIAYFILKIPNNKTGLADAYQFRQTQTAWGIREAIQNGYSFLNLRMPVLGAPYEVPFEFPLYQNLAGLFGNLFGLDEIEAGRFTSLLLFCIGGYLTFKLVEKMSSTSIAIFCTIVFYLTPFAIQWSNAVLIENLASFFLIVSAYIMRVYFERNSNWLLLLFILTTSLGALVKVTTIFPIIIWLALVLSWGTEFRFRPKSIIVFCFSLVTACIPAILWTNYADSIKRDNAFAEWLTSENLRNWNFGSLSQRFTEEAWVGIFARIWLIGGISTLIILPLLFVFLIEKKRSMRLLSLIALPFISPLVYFNLYFVHDYYFLAILFPTILSLALLIQLVQSDISIAVRTSTFICALLLLLIPSWVFTIQDRDYKVFIASDRNVVPPLALEIQKYTLPQDRIYVIGCDWDPSVLFYAERYGIAAPGWIGTTDKAITYLEENRMREEPGYLALCENSLPPVESETYSFEQISPNVWKMNART